MWRVFNFKYQPGILLSGFLMIALLGPLSGCASQKAVKADDIKNRGKLVAGVKYDSKPFGFLDSQGNLQGYDIDLMREIAKRIMGKPAEVEFQQVLSSTRVIALNSGSVDMVGATMTITPEREKVVDFSIPYYTAHQAVIVPKNSPFEKMDDLSDKTILFILGTTSEANIKKRLPTAKYVGFKSSTDAFSALKAKRGEAMTTDDSIIYGFLADNCGYRMLDEKLSDEPYGLAFKQGDGKEAPDDLRVQVNKHLADMKEDGTLDRLKAKWLDSILSKSSACKQ